MVIAVRAVFITFIHGQLIYMYVCIFPGKCGQPLLKLRSVLPETLFAFFAGECLFFFLLPLVHAYCCFVLFRFSFPCYCPGEGQGGIYHIGGFGKGMRFLFIVAFGAIEPFAALLGELEGPWNPDADIGIDRGL